MDVSESFLNGVMASFITLMLAMCGFIYKCKTRRLKCGCIDIVRDIDLELQDKATPSLDEKP